MGGISHSGFEFMCPTSGQISHCKIVSLDIPIQLVWHLHASVWTKPKWKQDGQEDLRSAESCSQFVRTKLQLSGYPEDPRSPTGGSPHLSRTPQISAPHSTHWQAGPFASSDSTRSRSQICLGRLRPFRGSLAIDSWASHRQLQRQAQSSKRLGCAPDFWIC